MNTFSFTLGLIFGVSLASVAVLVAMDKMKEEPPIMFDTEPESCGPLTSRDAPLISRGTQFDTFVDVVDAHDGSR